MSMASVLGLHSFRCAHHRQCQTQLASSPHFSRRTLLDQKLWVSSFSTSRIYKPQHYYLTKGLAMRKSNPGITSQLELESSGRMHKPVQSIYWLLLVNLGIFVADHMFKLNFVKALYLYHGWPKWYQFFTAMFCHLNWSHLSSNLFFLYIFGKLVEEEEGGLALWISYLITGAGANLVSWLILPRTVVSVGASGAVFGLFAISVLVKISWNWRKILEVFILGQFVLEKVMEAAQASAQMAGNSYGNFANVNHIAHLSGALVGVALIWLISHIPSPGPAKGKLEQKPHLRQ